MTEDQLEQETIGWLAEAGYSHRNGLDIAPDGSAPERSTYSQVLLVGRLREAINRLNPLVPMVAREDALQQVLNLGTPVLLAANRAFHQLLVNGVPVEYQKDDETRGDFVRLIDFVDVGVNEWLAVNQENDQQARLKSQWAALEKVVGAEPRIKQVAAAICLMRFEERSQAQIGKAAEWG